MKALILAAGLGSRLKDETENLPKALVKINGKPPLLYQLEALVSCGINDVVIVVGYKGERIRAFIDEIKKQEKFKDLKVKFVENKDYENTNSGYSFYLASEELNEPYIHLNCDILFFPSLMKRVVESRYENVIVLDKKITLEDKMEQVILGGDKIVKMQDMLLDGAIGKAVGVAKFSPKNVKWMADRARKHFENGEMKVPCFGIIHEAVDHVDYFGMDSGEDFVFEINKVVDFEKASALPELKNADAFS